MADEYSYIPSWVKDMCMRCKGDFYRKDGNHVSNGTNMCDDMYMASVLLGNSSRYNEVSGMKLDRVEMGLAVLTVKKRALLTSRVK